MKRLALLGLLVLAGCASPDAVKRPVPCWCRGPVELCRDYCLGGKP